MGPGVKTHALQPRDRLPLYSAMRSRRAFIILSGVLALAACAPAARDPGFAPTPPSGADAEINFYDYTTGARGADQSLTITFDDGSGPRTVGADLRPREFDFPSTPRYPTRASGTVSVTITLNRGGREAASTSFDLPLRSDWIWGVAIHTAVGNPMDSCIGCMGWRGQPIPPNLARTPGESLWINWSGNSIRHPAVY